MTNRSPSPSRAPLAGVRVLDLTRLLPGPMGTLHLADLGADVIKIERPGSGDDTRGWGPPFLRDAAGQDTAEAAYYLGTNRNKRSVTCDIARPEGQALVRDLAGRAGDPRVVLTETSRDVHLLVLGSRGRGVFRCKVLGSGSAAGAKAGSGPPSRVRRVPRCRLLRN
mgnify:CR=1 FL=1